MRTGMLGLALVSSSLVVGCTGSVDAGQDGIDKAKDLVVGFQFTTPIAVAQLGRTAIFDGCANEDGCREQVVELMSATIDQPTILSGALPPPGATKFDVTGAMPGSATIGLQAQNSGVVFEQAQAVQVMMPDRFELVPSAPFVRTVAPPTVSVPHMCPSPLRFETSVLATFNYRLFATDVALLGSGWYPWQSEQLTSVLPPDAGNDGAVVRFSAGPAPADSVITSPLGAEIPITIVDAYDGLALTEQTKAPTTEQERLIWAELTTGGAAVCFDQAVRTATSETPDICTVIDNRAPMTHLKGPGPYQLNWLAAGTCRVTFAAPALGLTATREYMPLP